MARGDSAERLGTANLGAARLRVERLANDHDGIAQVRDVGTATVDVLVTGLVPSQVVPGRPSRTHRVGGIDRQGTKDIAAQAVEVRTRSPSPTPADGRHGLAGPFAVISRER